MKVFCSSYLKVAVTALCSFLSGTTLLAENWNPMPDTGATKCYHSNGNQLTPCPTKGEPFYGQDAQYISVQPNYSDLRNGTVKDNSTGLIWQKSDNGTYRNWQDAKTYCSELDLAGISDWRIPTIFELYSIVDYTYRGRYTKPYINESYFECRDQNYWSSTAGFSPTAAWAFYFGLAISEYGDIETGWFTRCVSGGSSNPNFSLTNSGAVVFDITTGLEWQQADDGVQRSWEQALSYCENLESAGYNDWRLPNIKELNSIVDRAGYNPAINNLFNSKSAEYWSSTATVEATSNVPSGFDTKPRYVSFRDGYSRDMYPASTPYYVRCVRGGLSNYYITAQNYQFGNVDPRSDRFSVWMDISVNGQKPVEFCSYYQLLVDGDNGKGAKQILCTPLADTQTQPANTSRYRIDFEIGKDETYPTAAYFENGKITVRNVYTGSENILSGLNDFSVYGTTFDLREDAWSFRNRSWETAQGNSETYRKIIAGYIETPEERKSIPGGGVVDREKFNADVGMTGYLFNSYSQGLCYGLASSAIANFSRKNSAELWGQGGIGNWKTEIDNHWNQIDDHAVAPFKPFNKKVSDLTWNEASKMIMYYHAAQSGAKNSFNRSTWVGKDVNSRFLTPEKRTDEIIIINNILKKGRPAHVALPTHAVVLTQLFRYIDNQGEKTTWLIWDNEIPYSSSSLKSPYVEWSIRKYVPTQKYFYRINLDGNRELYGELTLPEKELPKIMLPCFYDHRDSQNIYDLWNEPCPVLPVAQAAAFSKTEVFYQMYAASVRYNAPDHIEVMFIGGAIDGIFNQATGEKIIPAFASDSLQPGQADIQSTMGGTWHLLHLPADATYRIEATKAADTPYAEVYATIPYPNGTVDKLHYDNIQLSENSATKFSFLIGRSNSDKIIHRTGGADQSPDYDINLDVAITPPSGFAGIPVAGQVQLRWKNSSHPRLSLVKVARKTTGFPASPTDGEEVYSGLSETATDSTVQSGTLYYYAAFSMDSSGNFSDSAAAAVDTARFAVTGTVTNNGAGLPNAKVEIRNSEQFPVGMTYTAADGSYVFANLEIGSYTVNAEIFGYSLNNSPQSVTVSNQNATADFTATAVPALRLPFDMDSLRIGSKVQIAWIYRNIDKNEMISVQKIAGGKTVVLAEVPASANYILWNVDGPATDNAIIKLSLKSNPAVAGQDELKILPKMSYANQSIIPAINLLLRKK